MIYFRKQKVWRGRWLSVAMALPFALAGFCGVQAAPARTAARIPGPIGGPDIAVDVNTMIGQNGPSFTLRDGEGGAYTVTPGKSRPLVIISHMGYN